MEEPIEKTEEKQCKEKQPRQTAHTLLAVIIPALMLGGFVLFALLSRRTNLMELALAALSVIFFAVLTLLMLPKFLAFFTPERMRSPSQKLGERSIKRLHPIFQIIIWAIIAQIIAYAVVFIADGVMNGVSGTVIAAYPRLFIASNGLEFGENTRTLIGSLGALSFVLPQHLERIISGPSYLLPIFILNMLVLCGDSLLLYELLLHDYDKRSSKFAVSLLLASPTMLLLLQPLSGVSLFLALSLCSLLFARKKRPLPAGLCALLACAVNLLAVLLFVPILMEGLRGCIISSAKTADRGREKTAPLIAGTVIGGLLPLLAGGAAVFFHIRTGRGIPAFFEQPRYFFEPLGRLADSLTEASAFGKLLLPALAIIAFAVLAFIACRRMRSSFAVFSLIWLAVAPSLLPSGLTVFAVFSFALLPAMESSVFSRRYLRTLYTFIMAAITLLFIFFAFVRH